MAHKKYDAVQQYATGTGNGVLSLQAAVSGKFRTLQTAGISNGDTIYVRIQHETIDAEWENVLCTYSAGTITPTLDSKSDSATGSLIAFSAGNKIVSGAVLAKQVLTGDNNGDVFTDRDVVVGRNLTVDGSTLLLNKIDEAYDTGNVVAAGTTAIGGSVGNYIVVSGNTGITAFDSYFAGAERVLRFTGTPLLTHNATSLILPSGKNIQVVAGDIAVFRSEGSGNWRCIQFLRVSHVGGKVLMTAIGVNFNAANTDNAIPVILPAGFTRFSIDSVRISHASQTLTTSTFALYTAAAAGGTAVVAAATANTVSTASEGTNNNSMSATVVNSGTQSWALASTPSLFFRTGTAQGAAATADVTIVLTPLP